MENITEPLNPEILKTLREFRNKQTEIIVSIGQIHLEIKSLQETISSFENEYKSVSSQFTEKLTELEKEFPNGEIDLNEGTISYQK